MTSPYGHTQIERVNDGISARYPEPPTYTVKAATTADISDLTAASVTVDGVTVAEGDVIALINQTDTTENGIYFVGSVASGAAPLTRSIVLSDETDEVIPGLSIFVSQGTANGNKRFQLTADAPIVIGTSNLVFAEVLTDAALGGGVLVTMQAVNATLAAGTVTINSGITIASTSEVVPVLIGALSGTTNFGQVGELKASRVNGAPGVGTVVIQAYGDDGALDVDAAGAIRVLIFTPQP